MTETYTFIDYHDGDFIRRTMPIVSKEALAHRFLMDDYCPFYCGRTPAYNGSYGACRSLPGELTTCCGDIDKCDVPRIVARLQEEE